MESNPKDIVVKEENPDGEERDGDFPAAEDETHVADGTGGAGGNLDLSFVKVEPFFKEETENLDIEEIDVDLTLSKTSSVDETGGGESDLSHLPAVHVEAAVKQEGGLQHVVF
ncbi:hypothetical protein AAG570_007055 [Ranatra chinensis]|uniref:Uncharacterized protein n=1 Tax=Ranatra chinensis TaxID=642074 RepID=A0ABD0YD92_9HEMI